MRTQRISVRQSGKLFRYQTSFHKEFRKASSFLRLDSTDALKRSMGTRAGERIKWWGGEESLASIRGKRELYAAGQRLHFAAVPILSLTSLPGMHCTWTGKRRAACWQRFRSRQAHTALPLPPGPDTAPRPAHPGNCSPAVPQGTSSERLRDYNSQHTGRGPPPLQCRRRARHANQCGSPQASGLGLRAVGLTL